MTSSLKMFIPADETQSCLMQFTQCILSFQRKTVRCILNFFLFVFVDKSSARSKREVFDLPSPVNYQQDYVIETLVVADKKMTDFHGVEELKTYVPSLINIVSNWGKSWYVIFLPCYIAILIQLLLKTNSNKKLLTIRSR